MNIISGRQAAKKAGMRYSTFMEYVLAGDIPARRVENRNWEIPEELLDESRIRAEGYLEAAPIRKKWNEHLSGKRNWQYHLFRTVQHCSRYNR